MKSGGKPRNLKQNNMRAVLDLLRRGDIASVADLSAEIRLSKTTIKKIFDSLLESGLVVSAGKGDSTDEGGKKPELYRFNPSHGYVIGIHVTPDAMIAVTTNLNADITFLSKSEIGRDRDLAAILDRVADLIRTFVGLKSSSGETLLGVTVVLPGLVNPAGGISIYSPHYRDWGRDVPFVELLKERLGPSFGAQINIDNANRYQAVAESEKGVARGIRNFIIIDALPEGLGSGIMLQGTLMDGNQSLSGEIGHMTVDVCEDFACICGHKGCLEAMVSARRILGIMRKAAPDHLDSELFARKDPSAVDLDDICESAARGDRFARTLIDEAIRWFLVGLGNIIMTNDPELVVIQGTYVKAGQYFLDGLRNGIRHIGLPDVEKKVRIEYSTMGEERGVIGGAAHLISQHFSGRVFS